MRINYNNPKKKIPLFIPIIDMRKRRRLIAGTDLKTGIHFFFFELKKNHVLKKGFAKSLNYLHYIINHRKKKKKPPLRLNLRHPEQLVR